MPELTATDYAPERSLPTSTGSYSGNTFAVHRGVKDYGTLVQGHAGILDRIDSLCFAAPVFYHLTTVFFAM